MLALAISLQTILESASMIVRGKNVRNVQRISIVTCISMSPFEEKSNLKITESKPSQFLPFDKMLSERRMSEMWAKYQ